MTDTLACPSIHLTNCTWVTMMDNLRLVFDAYDVYDWMMEARKEHGDSGRYNNHDADLKFVIDAEGRLDDLSFSVECVFNNCEFVWDMIADGKVVK